MLPVPIDAVMCWCWVSSVCAGVACAVNCAVLYCTVLYCAVFVLCCTLNGLNEQVRVRIVLCCSVWL